MKGFSIKMDFGVLKKLEKAQIQALEVTAEALHTEVVQAQVMPFESGNLQNESTFVDLSKIASGEATLVNDTPYARRLYYHPEYNFQKGENPNARGEWYEDWLPGGGKEDFAPKAYAAYYKKLTGV